MDRSQDLSPTNTAVTSGHTPGPWEWTGSVYDRTALVARHAEGGGDYVLTPECDVGDYGLSCDKSIDVSEANARLIAAAPELLEALKAVVAWKDIVTLVAPQLGGLLSAIYQAEAAIAKAEGK